MSINVAATRSLIADQNDARLARGILEDLSGPDGYLLVGDGGAQATRLPREIGVILQQVLQTIANGESVTVMSTPEELTTSAAAALLGVSRPTLMKLVREGSLPATKVGTHTRVKSADVLALRAQRRARERAAFQALLEAEGDED